ncbi:hypothetical protein TRVL_06305 [Trypanosoma vivax]|nr:hypothetical protein TRVL_06305 [Trypanosoma vivax]
MPRHDSRGGRAKKNNSLQFGRATQDSARDHKARTHWDSDTHEVSGTYCGSGGRRAHERTKERPHLATENLTRERRGLQSTATGSTSEGRCFDVKRVKVRFGECARGGEGIVSRRNRGFWAVYRGRCLGRLV